MQIVEDTDSQRARPWRAGGPLLGILMMVAAGCGPSGPGGDAPVPGGAEGTAADGAGASLLLRGRIRPEALVLEPVFLLDSTRSTGADRAGRHRVVGTDQSGAVLFDVGVDGAAVADAEGREEHFQLLWPTTEERAARLHRVELRAADGRTAHRTATFTRQALREALAAGDLVSARRTADGRVRLTWSEDQLPALLVRDPLTGRILAFGRGGQLTLTTDRGTLEITASDGVQSGSAPVPVR